MGNHMGLTEVYNAQNLGLQADVDIVAVHGIGAEPIRTWVANDVQWLSDAVMLPRDLPNSRIMCFGYESEWLGKTTIKQRLPNVADTLLQALKSRRKVYPKRPLILVGHCFGGLVAEKAIVEARLQLDKYRDVFYSIRGLVTLGTPHRGSGSQSSAGKIATIASAFGYGEKKSLLTVIGEDSEVLSDLVHTLARIVILEKIGMCCFFEQQPSDILKLLRPKLFQWPTKKEMVVDEESACIPGMSRFGLASDHFQMHRFSSNTDPNFRLVSEQIAEFSRTPSKEAESSHAESLTESDQEALNTLFLTDPYDDLERICSRLDGSALESTQWIGTHETFSNWADGKTSSVLWLSGDPGKGKTVIAASLAKENKPFIRGSSETLTLYFFCSQNDDRRLNVTSILRGLLYQLASQRHDLCRFLTVEWSRQKQQLVESENTTYTLWRLLHQMAQQSALANIIIIIDALDECDTESLSILLGLLRPYTEVKEHQSAPHSHVHNNFDSRFRWFLTSRRHETISAAMECADHINLEYNAIHVENAVEAFIEKKVAQLSQTKSYGSELKHYVEATLKEKSEGTFLWVSLACEELSKPRVRAMNTRSTLSKLPHGLNPLYDDILKEILTSEDEDDEMVKYAKQILHAMTIAIRPLEIVELAVAAGLPSDVWESTDTIVDCVKACGSLVHVQRGAVYFVHLSAKAYIQSINKIISQNVPEDHEPIARRCFDAVFGTESSHSQSERSLPLEKIPYQVQFWSSHARHAAPLIETHIFRNANFMGAVSSKRDDWFDKYWSLSHSALERRPENMSLLLISAYLGLAFLIEKVLAGSQVSRSQERDSQMNTPLIWAVKSGDSASVEALLSYGVEINAFNDQRQTACYCAAAQGHAQLLKSLAKHNANLQFPDIAEWSPLHRAVNSSKSACVQTLLDQGVNYENKDLASWTPLQRASSIGSAAMLSVLLNHGANIEVRDREGMTPLQTAAWNGHTDAVATLLQAGAALNVRDPEGWTALHHAAWAGHPDTSQLLIRRGLSTDCRNNDHNTPLFLATWNGHHDLVQLLIQSKADVNAPCADGETVLMQAAWAGHVKILQLLIDHGASLNTVTRSGISALHQASSNGQQDATQLLLDAGADPFLEDADGQTAFQHAEENSYPSTAKLLQSLSSPDVDDGEFQHTAITQATPSKLDTAVADALMADASCFSVFPHGHACSSSPWRVQVDDDHLRQFFLKTTSVNDSMFAGEFTSLEALKSVVPDLCPAPIKFGKLVDSEGYFLVTQFVDLYGTSEPAKQRNVQSFAQKLAKLHTSPAENSDQGFGFAVTTFAGPIEQCNEWKSSWSDFYANNRLRYVSKIVAARHHEERELVDRVEQIAKEVVPKLISDDRLNDGKGVTPALVHGDLWSGNKARGVIYDEHGNHDGKQDYAFDASCCYAHSEYELGLTRMFGGFSAGFFSEYHKLVPKTKPVEEYEDRMRLYQLYHWLVNYAISGGGFKDEAMSCMNQLLEKFGGTR